MTAPGVVHRKSVHEAVQTGIMVIDALVPIGRGQRELILGDRATGKTAIALDTIVASRVMHEENDPSTHMKFIYVASGQRKSAVAKLSKTLKDFGVLKHTAVLLATASDAAIQQVQSPYTGCVLGEYIRDTGRH